MTIKHLKELLATVIDEGVDENQEIYLETYSDNKSGEIIIAKSNNGSIVYISDIEPDGLITDLKEEGYSIKELY